MSLGIHKILPSRRDASLPEFDGTNIPLRRFLRHARKAIDGADNLPTMYALILAKIVGPARERVQESSTDFDSMAAVLKVAFGSADDSKYWQERLLAVEQKPGQSVVDYGKDVQWIRSNVVEVIRDEHEEEEELLCGMIRIIDELSMRAFLKGLSGDLKDRDAMKMKFENLEQAIDCAGTEEAELLKEIPPPAVMITSVGTEEAELLEEGPPPAVTIASADAILPSRRDSFLLIFVPEFDGTNIPLRRFLRLAECVIDAADNPSAVCGLILAKIVGAAKERVQESSRDFDSMAADLKAAFGSADDSKHWQERLLAVEQKPGQSVADYGKDVQWVRSNIIEVIRDEHEEDELLCGMIRMIDDLSMRAFLKGLSGDLQDRDAMKIKFENLEQAIDCAGTEEAELLKEIPPPAVTITSAVAEKADLLEEGPPLTVTIASADAILPSRRDSLLLIYVPEFDGTNVPLRRFLRRARYVMNTADNVSAVYALILSKIKGVARERVQESSRDLDSMAADLKVAFGSADDSKHWQERLLAVKQKPRQSVPDYGKEVQWIRSNIVEIIRDEHEEELHCGMIRMIDELSLRAFLKGLSGDLQDRDAMKMKFENLEQAIDCAGAEVAELLDEGPPPVVTIASAGAEEAELLEEGPPSAVTIASVDAIPKICSLCGVASHTDSTCAKRKENRAFAGSAGRRQCAIRKGRGKVKQCKYCMNFGHLIEHCRKRLNKRAPANLELRKIYNIFQLAARPENYVRLDCLNPTIPIHEVATENGARRMVYLHVNNRRHVFYLSLATSGSESGILGNEFMMSQGATLNYKGRVVILSNKVELPFDGNKVIIEASPIREAEAYTYVNED